MDTVEDRIVAVLRAEPGVQMCDGCLALAVKVSLTEAQAAIAALGGDAGFQVAEGGCSSCQRRKTVVGAVRHVRTG